MKDRKFAPKGPRGGAKPFNRPGKSASRPSWRDRDSGPDGPVILYGWHTVTMTLLAYDLPRAAVFTSAPGWSDLAQTYSGKLAGFALSFIIAGLFWISHHRRLARQAVGTRGAVILNLFFLLSIVLLPVTNGLYTNYAMQPKLSAA